MPFFHEIKIRQNAYCILEKNGKGFLRTLDASTPEVREQKSHCALSILRNTTAFHFYCILISFTRVTTILWQYPIHFALFPPKSKTCSFPQDRGKQGQSEPVGTLLLSSKSLVPLRGEVSGSVPRFFPILWEADTRPSLPHKIHRIILLFIGNGGCLFMSRINQGFIGQAK